MTWTGSQNLNPLPLLQLSCAMSYHFKVSKSKSKSIQHHMGRNPNASWGLQLEMKAHCLRSVTQHPTPASFTNSLFVKISEAHLCYEKKIQTGPDCAGSLWAFQSNKESWAPWWAPIMGADLPCRHVRNITRQAASFSGKGLSAGSELWRRL